MQSGRTFDEFWSLSPAQIGFAIRALHRQQLPEQRKGTAADLMRIFAPAGGIKRVAGAPKTRPGGRPMKD